jgi:hypothetical protein
MMSRPLSGRLQTANTQRHGSAGSSQQQSVALFWLDDQILKGDGNLGR